jgi:hypothetical protein
MIHGRVVDAGGAEGGKSVRPSMFIRAITAHAGDVRSHAQTWFSGEFLAKDVS